MAAIIGLVPLVDKEKDSYWMVPGYMEGITAAGGIPIMLPLTEDAAVIHELAQRCSGFLLTGGQDVSPKLYGEQPLPQCGECCPKRDTMEQLLLTEALKADKPVLGICRGIQLLNAVLGGTLYQDIPSQLGMAEKHHQKPPYHVPSHTIELTAGTPLAELLQKKQIAVNSYHHQGIYRLAPALRKMAEAPDGLIEAVYMPEKRFVWGVQWHPEFSWRTDGDSRKIFTAFVSASAG